jgi:CRP-like cAMP-binding protein
MALVTLEPEDLPRIAQITSHSQLFYDMPPASLEDLVRSVQLIKADAESELLSPAESRARIRGLFLIIEGSVTVNGVVLGRGAFFGEAALFDIPLAESETAGVAYTRTSCACLLITRERLEAWLSRHALADVFFRHLSAELCQRLYLRRELSLSA